MTATRAGRTSAITGMKAMTEQPRLKKRRWSKRAVRATAWTAGATAFISALGAFGASSAPLASDQPTPGLSPQRVIIERRIVKRIVIVDPASPAPVRVVSTGNVPAPAPAPPPAPSTGGS